MNVKKVDKIVIGILYVVFGVIVLILVVLLIYILVRGILYILWEFLI